MNVPQYVIDEIEKGNRKLGQKITAFAAIILLLIGAVVWIGATKTVAYGFDELGLSNGDGDFQFLNGETVCHMWGAFDGATATVQVLRVGTIESPVEVVDITSAKLVGAIQETDFVNLVMGADYYRLNVTGGGGSEDINWRCRRSSL